METSEEDVQLESWDRELFKPGGGNAALFYVVFGEFEQPLRVSRSEHRTEGVPEELEVIFYTREEHGEYLDPFLEGALAEGLQHYEPELFEEISTSPHCLIVRGEIKDPSNLNYLRDTVGFLTALFEQGAVAINDAFRIGWWDEQSWRERIFDVGRLIKFHVFTMYSEDENQETMSPEDEEDNGVLWWVHTRGLIKFGRPDISIRGVPRECLDAAVDACERLIEKQGLGLTVEEGQEVRLPGFPPGMTWHHGGDFEDLDFNNVHIEAWWK